MNIDEPRTPGETRPETEVVADLIRSAGRRAAPPEAAYRQTLEVATNAWRNKTDRIRQRRRFARLATSVAAGVATLAVLFAFVPRRGGAPAARVATLERIIGRIEIRGAGEAEWRLLQDDTASLAAGAGLRTGSSSRAGVMLAGGSSLRLAEGTEVVLDTPARLQLVAGRAYVDSGRGERAGEPVEIVTPTATAIDVGTQFEVSLLGETYRLRVREGRVVLRHGGESSDGAAGDQLLIGPDGRLERTSILTTDADWQWTFDMVLRHAFLVAQVGGGALADGGGGVLAFVASISGLTSSPMHAAYGAAKAALMSLVRSVAVELGPRGVRVNAVAPGGTLTPRMLEVLSPEERTRVAQVVPSRRLSDPSEIAGGLLFAVSDLASNVTGQVLVVDGGGHVAYPYPVDQLGE